VRRNNRIANRCDKELPPLWLSGIMPGMNWLSPPAIDEIKIFLQQRIWQIDIVPLPPMQRFAIATLRLLIALFREMSGGDLNLRAMSLVYTTLLSLVPLIALTFSILKAFGVHNEMEPMLLAMVEPLGENSHELVTYLLQFVENMRVGLLGAVGLAFLLYTIIALLQKIEAAFNAVWHVHHHRPIARRIADYLTITLVGPILIFTTIGITATLIKSPLLLQIASIEPFGSLMVIATRLTPWIVVIIAFTLLYLIIPNTHVNWRSALFGGVVGGVLWQSAGWLFAAFVAGSGKYTAIYSGLAILVFFIIWLYFSWLVLLFGAKVAYFHQYPESMKLAETPLPLSPWRQQAATLTALTLIAARFYNGERPYNDESLATALALPQQSLYALLQSQLTCGTLISCSGGEENQWLLTRDPAQLRLSELLYAIHRNGEEDTNMPNPAIAATVNELLQQQQQILQQHHHHQTLADLAHAHLATPPAGA
jgi:membrane protein